MRAANVNGEASIDSTDRTILRNSAESNLIYTINDVNLDGVVDSTDRSIAQAALESIEVIN